MSCPDTSLFQSSTLLLKFCPFLGQFFCHASTWLTLPGLSIYSLRVSTEEFLALWDWMLSSTRAGTPGLVWSRCIGRLSFLGALSLLPRST